MEMPMPDKCRKIIHVDMDAFFASVEQRDNPKLKGKPVIVGGPPELRGVVSTASYEARKFGVHSAMPTKTALRLCPKAVFLRTNMEKYIKVSEELLAVMHEFTDIIEPLSIDEAFLDVTVNKFGEKSATRLARKLQKRIWERTRLTSSAGVSYNKFLAKIASDLKKPCGLSVITPEKAQEFIDSLPIEKFYGVGKVTAAKFKKLGINSGGDLKEKSIEWLTEHFGKAGDFYYYTARGIDERPVETEYERKSLGREITFPHDIDDIIQIREILKDLSKRVEELLAEENLTAKTVTLKVRYEDFSHITRQISLPELFNDSETIYNTALKLLERTEAGPRKVRLLGISTSGFPTNSPPPEPNYPIQLEFKF